MTAPIPERAEVPPGRKWLAISVATAFELVSYWLIVLALVASVVGEESRTAGAAIAVGLTIVPFVFIAAAFLSRNPTASMGILKAMGLFVVVGLLLNGLGSPAGGLVGGFGAGAVVTIRSESADWWKVRTWGIAGVTLYIVLLERLVPEAAVFAGGFFPFIMIGFADAFSIWRESRRETSTTQE